MRIRFSEGREGEEGVTRVRVEGESFELKRCLYANAKWRPLQYTYVSLAQAQAQAQ